MNGLRIAFLSCSGLAALTACGGGSDSTGGGGGGNTGNLVSGLQMPQQMTIVEAQGSASSQARVPGVSRMGESDYDNDVTRLWVQDDSMEPLEIINEILCYISQTGYADEDVVNAGPYLALIDVDSCQQGQREAVEGPDAGSADGAVEYQEWTVDSKRADNNAPHIVDIWFDQTEERGQGLEVESRFYVKVVIDSSPTETQPYGSFTLNFKSLAREADPDTGTPFFKGTLATVDRNDGSAEYTFYNGEGDVTQPAQQGDRATLMRARVVTEDQGSSGRAYTSMVQRYNEGSGDEQRNSTFHVTYNDDYLARRRLGDQSEERVFDRNDFDTTAWRYGLYHADSGNRVRIRSGIPLRNANGVHGWVGHHGMWFPDDVRIANGETLFEDRRGNGGDPREYTAFIQAGKLRKRTALELTLDDVADEDLFFWGRNEEALLRWTDGELMKFAVRGREGRMQRLQEPVSMSGEFEPFEWIHFWSDARGSIGLVWPEQGPPNGQHPITLQLEETVNRESADLANGDLTLFGYFNAPRPNVTEDMANYIEGLSPFFEEVFEPQSGIEYTFRRSDLMLLQDGQPVNFASGFDPLDTQSADGVYSGPLVTSRPQQVWEIHDARVSYTWEYGPRPWNRFQTVVDSEGRFVRFDPPLRVDYEHDEPSRPRFDGKIFGLEYQGFGDLHGIPHEEEDNGRWRPLFTIPTGTVVTDSDQNSYRVKILEGEQRMVAVPNAQQVMQSEGLSFGSPLTPPEDEYVNPSIGAKPAVDDAPLFVGGEKQEDS